MLEFFELHDNRVTNQMLRSAFEELARPGALGARMDGLRKYLREFEARAIPIPEVDEVNSMVRWYEITCNLTAIATNIVARGEAAIARLDGINKDIEVARAQNLTDQQKLSIVSIAGPMLAASAEARVGCNEAKQRFRINPRKVAGRVGRPDEVDMGLVEAQPASTDMRHRLADARDGAWGSLEQRVFGSGRQ